MSNNETIITEYVPRELFDIHMENIKENRVSDEKLTDADARFEALEKLLDARLEKMQSTIEKNLAEFKAVSSETKAEISDIRGDVRTLNEKVEHAIDTLSVAISNNNQRLDDFKGELEEKQASSAAKIGIFTALFIGAIQVIVSVVLHFWF